MGLSVNFYVRDCKRTKNGTAPLEVAINVYSKRVFVSLPYKLTPEEFKKKRQPKALTDYMAMMRSKVNQILTDMMVHGEPITAKSVAEYLKNGCFRPYTIEDLFNNFLEIKKSESGNTIEPTTYRKYVLTRDLFYTIISKDRSTEEITNAVVLKFKSACDSKYGEGTSAGYVKRLKSVIKYGMDNGKIKVNPCQGVKVSRTDKPIQYLKEWEVLAFENGRLPNDGMAKVRDFCTLQLLTGMAYSDMALVTKEDIKEKGGVYYIEKPRKKTKKVFTSVILDYEKFIGIIEKYGGKAPEISLKTVNVYLKAIRDLFQIHTHMTSHVFRRTYASELVKRGVRYEIIAAAIGDNVSTLKKHYAALENDTILNEISTKIM